MWPLKDISIVKGRGRIFWKTTDQPKLAVSITPPSSAVNWPSVLTDHITELGLAGGVQWASSFLKIFDQTEIGIDLHGFYFRAFCTTSNPRSNPKPRKILPKQSSSNIFSSTKRSYASALPVVPRVCVDHYYHARVRVCTELQNPEQDFFI